MTNLDSILKSRDITLLTKVYLVKAMVFSSSHVWMWEVDYKERWALRNWCFWIVVLEKTLENLLDSKEIKPVNPKGNQPLTFIERTDAETEFQILWPSDEKSWLIEKDPNAGKDWGWDVWMASLIQWTWIWANSRRQWKTEESGVLQSMGLQRVGYELAIQQQHFLLWI